MNKKQAALNDLQTLRNVGLITAEKLYSLGIKSSRQMKQSDPVKLFHKLKKKNNGHLDPCVLYQFIGAIRDIPWPKCKKLVKKTK